METMIPPFILSLKINLDSHTNTNVNPNTIAKGNMI
jgi:hypothetical protein